MFASCGRVGKTEAPEKNQTHTDSSLDTFELNNNRKKDRILRLSGTSKEIGKKHGETYRSEIKSLLNTWLLPKINPRLGTDTERRQFRNILEAMNKEMTGRTSVEFRLESEALATTTGIHKDHVMLSNNIADIWQLLGAGNYFGCSTLTIASSRSSTGGMLIGRNLDYPDSEVLRGKWKPVLFARSGTLKIFSVHIPGLSSVLTGINEKGVFLAIKVSDGNTTRFGSPSGYIFRSILERAKTAKHALELYKLQKRTVALNITIADGRDAYELEIDATKFGVRTFSSKGTLYGANHFEHAKMGGSANNRDSRWQKLAKFDGSLQPVSLADVKSAIGDAGGFNGDGTSNVLAVFVDYKSKEIIFGSDPKNKGASARGELAIYKFDDIFNDVSRTD